MPAGCIGLARVCYHSASRGDHDIVDPQAAAGPLAVHSALPVSQVYTQSVRGWPLTAGDLGVSTVPPKEREVSVNPAQ